MQPLYRAKTITIKLDNFKHVAETIQFIVIVFAR